MNAKSRLLIKDKELRHDFVNGIVRLQIISELIAEDLENNKDVENQLVLDLKKQMELQIKIIDSIGL